MQKPIGFAGIAHGDVEDSLSWMQRLMLSCRVSVYPATKSEEGDYLTNKAPPSDKELDTTIPLSVFLADNRPRRRWIISWD
jgi:hypothetical protein